MSKKKKTSEATVAPAEAVATAEVAPTEATPVAPVEKKKAKKGVSRFFAFLTILVCAAVVVFLPLTVFNADWTEKSQPLFETVKAMFGKDMPKMFSFLPVLLDGKGTEVMIANLLPYVLALALVLALVFSLIALFAGKKGLVCAAYVLIAIGAAAYAGGTWFVSNAKATKAIFDFMAIGLFAAAIILLIIVCACTSTKAKKEKKVKEKPVEEPVDPVAVALAEFRKEEYVEAYAYDGGPVAGVQLAEEVFPTLSAIDAAKDPSSAAQATVASLLGNGFDAFLITLNEQEKGEFIDLYVLKCKGMMPEIPGYVVGGDNKDFFNKVFIYLGQYREKIPTNLLNKMYTFAMKI